MICYISINIQKRVSYYCSVVCSGFSTDPRALHHEKAGSPSVCFSHHLKFCTLCVCTPFIQVSHCALSLDNPSKLPTVHYHQRSWSPNRAQYTMLSRMKLVGNSHLDILSTSTAFSRRFFIRSRISFCFLAWAS